MNSLSQLSEEELDFLISQKQNAQQKKQTNINSDYSPTRSGILGALDSATLGFYPKIAGATIAPIRKLTNPAYQEQSLKNLYEQARDEIRGEMQTSVEQNPVSSFVGNIAGSAILPFPAKTVQQGAKIGALYGGAYGLGTSDAGDVGKLGIEDLMNIAKGGASGGALGALGTYGANLFAKERIPPSEKNTALLNLSEQFDIPATYGELSGKPGELAKEEAALKGRMGSSNQKNFAEFKDLQKSKIKDAALNLRNQFGQEEFLNKGNAATEAISNLQNKALEERKQFSNVYQEAKNKVATLSKENFAEFNNNLKENLTNEVITEDNAPKAFGELNALAKIFNQANKKEINIKQLEAWRQGLNQTYKSALNSGDEKTGFALNKIKNNFDNFMEESLEKALLEGDQDALLKFKEARQLAANWYKKYGDTNSKNFGKKFIGEMIERARVKDESLTDEMVVNKIFGTSEIGFKPESTIIVRELKKNLPTEDFNKIKLEAAQKILEPLINENPSAVRYNTSLKKFLNSNQSLAKELFSKQEIAQLNDLGKISGSILTRQKSLINPSGTAEVILDYLQNKTGTGFLKNLFNKIELNQNKIAEKIKRGEKIQKEPSVVFKLPNTNLTEQKQNDKEEEFLLQPETSGESLPQSNKQGLAGLTDAQLSELISKKTLLPQEQKILDKISTVESGNNPNAKSKTSSASGLLQFTNSTWNQMVKKYGNNYGISIKDKNDPEAQKIMASHLLQENREFLKNALKKEPTEGELYLAHFMGAQGAAKLINSPKNEIAARLFPKEAKANKNIFFAKGRPRTINEVYSLITRKI